MTRCLSTRNARVLSHPVSVLSLALELFNGRVTPSMWVAFYVYVYRAQDTLVGLRHASANIQSSAPYTEVSTLTARQAIKLVHKIPTGAPHRSSSIDHTGRQPRRRRRRKPSRMNSHRRPTREVLQAMHAASMVTSNRPSTSLLSLKPHHCGRPSRAQQVWPHTLGCGGSILSFTPIRLGPFGPVSSAARKGQEALPSLVIYGALRTGSQKRKYPCRLLWCKSAFPPCHRCIGTWVFAAVALTRAGEHAIPRPERDESRAAPPLVPGLLEQDAGELRELGLRALRYSFTLDATEISLNSQ